MVAGRSNINGVWGAYFEKLLNPNNQPTQSIPVDTLGTVLGSGKTSEASQSLLNTEIEEEEVSMALNQIKIGKAAGNDRMIAEMLRHPRRLKVIITLFKKCFQLKRIPTQWHVGIIVPISKQGAKDQMDPSQYGGITLLSVIYKAFCRILGSRLVGIIESEKLLSDEQNGFRKGRGCIDHVLALNLLNAIRMKAKETYSTSQK